MPCGGRRLGAGRKSGKVTQATRDKQAVVAEALRDGRTPLEYMLSVMRDPSVDPDRRDRMALAAAQFVHPRLQLLAVQERRFSDLPEPERRAEAQRLIAEARAVIERARAEQVIDGGAVEVEESL